MSYGISKGLPALRWYFATTIASLLLTTLLTLTPATAQHRETIFDRTVHLEPTVLTEIPHVPRLEDELGIEGRRIRVGDAELWVEEEGSGIPLVLINGGPGGTHHGFHPWFSKAADFARVIYYDQRGCGLSDYEPGPDGYSVEQAVEDLEGIRRALDVDTFVLLGFSYGGFLAQYYTTQHPEKVAGLVLVGAAPNVDADLGQSRQREFISPEEQERMQDIGSELRKMAPDRGWSSAELLALLVYNNHLNGDWKRQHYFRPSREDIARTALYEWVQDGNFNGIMNQSAGRVSLTGAFDSSPIPTLIMEGEWDLTWGPEKRTALAANHPNGTLVTFEKAGHSIFNEDPDAFFDTLHDFIQGISPVEKDSMATFQTELQAWQAAFEASPEYSLRSVDWGQAASEEIAAAFLPDWLDGIGQPTDFLRLGFALYDVERYEEALGVFEAYHAWGRQGGDDDAMSVAGIWAGHMLDLLGRREGALARYMEVVELGRTDTWSHGQYGLRYAPKPYAEERMKTPFERIANQTR